MDERLTLPQAREMVGEILTSEPRKTFGSLEGCKYFDDQGEPVCVAGHVFARIGITPGDLNAAPAIRPNTARFSMIEPVWQKKITLDAGEFIYAVQLRQDEGISWGDVYQQFFENEAHDEAASTEAL